MQLRDVESFYPLSPLQQGILFHSLSEPSSRMYFNQTLATLRGDLDVEAFRSAWQEVCARHAILRTFFVWERVKEPIQVVKKAATMPFEVEDWRTVAAGELDARTAATVREDLERGISLSQAPLMRVRLLRTAEDRHELLWTFHHILMDGWSMFRVLGDLFGAYDALRAGRAPVVEPTAPYRDYIAWIGKQSLPIAETFWRTELSGFRAPTELPLDAESSGVVADGISADDFATRPLLIDAETTAALEALARRHRLTLNTVLQGAWALLLARSAGEDDVAFGAVVAGRPAELAGVETMVGLFINTLPVRVTTPAAEPLVPWLQALQARQAELREYEYSPLALVQTWSDVAGGAPLFESIFLFENYHKDGSIEELCESLAIEDVRWFERHNYPLAALVVPGPELLLRIIYRTDRYTAAGIDRLLVRWRTLLGGIARASDAAPRGPEGALGQTGGTTLGDLALASDAEHAEAVARNRTATDYPRDRCVHELFEEQARATPDACALVAGDEALSYGELDARSNRLARRLRALGAGPEVPVGVCLERSAELVVAILAILKAGGAYVPLDPDYPADRLEFMFRDTRMPVLVTRSGLEDALPGHGAAVVRIDTDHDAIEAESGAALEHATGPLNLAYVIYTSGSTGRPKGTCIPHRAVVRLVRGTDFLEVTPADVFLQFATISFDASTLELWGSLLNGARLAVFPPGTPSPEELGRELRDRGVTILWLTAGLFHQMVERHVDGLRGVKQLLAGGDVLSPGHVRTALAELPECTLVNGYGPTENTTFTCCQRMSDPDEIRETVPIGRPIANTTAYVLDERLRPVPVGVAGDLWTGGDGLARGYLNRPGLTAERFVPDPFGAPGSRLYRTGDRARHRPDGTIEFLGRDDFQVKVRGFRIEPGEIESALSEHPSVRDTVVVARGASTDDKRLVAYVAADAIPAQDELRAFLAERLPAYMVPSAFVTLESFPLTTNGKVDRDALPDPDAARPELETAFAAPAAGTQATIADVWAEVLGLERVGAHDNFFDLGGHSLAMIRVHGKLKEALGRELKMVDLFKYPTVDALARFADTDPEEPPVSTGDEAGAEKRRAGQDRLAQLRKRREGR